MPEHAFLSEGKYGHRLNMYLCHCSSEEAIFPATALRAHTPSTTGWKSARFCTYPQELGFCFGGEVELNYIRVLCHESNIPTRIEVFVANTNEGDTRLDVAGSYEHSDFQQIGYVHFSSGNESAMGFRELKTIKICRKCVFVKFLILDPYSSSFNTFSQVGIVAISGHGRHVRNLHRGPQKNICAVGESVEVPLEKMVPPSLDRLPSVSSESNSCGEVDLVTRRRLAELIRVKEHAVLNEDYDLAGALRSALDSLEAAGKRIYMLEQQKKAAVEKEDYALAKKLKDEIEGIRKGTYALQVDHAVSIRRATPSNSAGQRDVQKGNACIDGKPIKGGQYERQSPLLAPSLLPPSAYDEVPVIGTGFYNLDNASVAENNQEYSSAGVIDNLDDVSACAAQGKEKWEQILISKIVMISGGLTLNTDLDSGALIEAKKFERTFGLACCGCLFGRRVRLREAAVRAISTPEVLGALLEHASNVTEMFLSYLVLPNRGLSDATTSVVIACCDALHVVVDQMEQTPSLSSLIPQLSLTLPILVCRLGDANNRVRERAESCLLTIAKLALDAVVVTLKTDPQRKKQNTVSHRVHTARLGVLKSLVDLYGADGTVSADLEAQNIISEVVLPCMEHSSGEVRDAASSLFAKLLLVSPGITQRSVKFLKSTQWTAVQRYLSEFMGGAYEEDFSQELDTSDRLFPREGPAVVATSDLEESTARANSPTANDVASKTCHFCGEYSESFVEASLDIHFIRACPMLCPCPLCDQVTEIATLQRHLTSECENRHLVRECPRCKEAVRVEDIQRHILAESCIEAVPTHSVCPLCHARFKAGMNGWLSHLAAPPGCPKNPKKYDGSGPIAE